MYKMTLGRVVAKIPSKQDVIVREYLTGLIQEHANAEEICRRLDYMQETRNANVYGISYEDNAIVIDI